MAELKREGLAAAEAAPAIAAAEGARIEGFLAQARGGASASAIHARMTLYEGARFEGFLLQALELLADTYMGVCFHACPYEAAPAIVASFEGFLAQARAYTFILLTLLLTPPSSAPPSPFPLQEIASHTCPICYELMVPPDHSPMLLFPCGHSFCAACLAAQVRGLRLCITAERFCEVLAGPRRSSRPLRGPPDLQTSRTSGPPDLLRGPARSSQEVLRSNLYMSYIAPQRLKARKRHAPILTPHSPP